LKWHWKVPLVFVWLAVSFILLALSMFPYNANCKCKY
jgi:succinate-acetate transporter protein